jgi:RHS repeat-associated protein
VPLTTTDATGTELAPSAAYTALGFPGQTRTLPDLWYNRHRDYDPGTGRYIQADPIGLAGDANPYLYAKANPLRYVDLMGLNPAATAVAEVGFEWWLKRQLRPGRATPWGRAIGIGEAIGATAAVGMFVYKQSCSKGSGDGDNTCLEGWDREANGYCVKTFRGEARRRC